MLDFTTFCSLFIPLIILIHHCGSRYISVSFFNNVCSSLCKTWIWFLYRLNVLPDSVLTKNSTIYTSTRFQGTYISIGKVDSSMRSTLLDDKRKL